MSRVKIRVVLIMPWWVKFYLRTLRLFCYTFNVEPDCEKVSKFILKRSTCRVVR